MNTELGGRLVERDEGEGVKGPPYPSVQWPMRAVFLYEFLAPFIPGLARWMQFRCLSSATRMVVACRLRCAGVHTRSHQPWCCHLTGQGQASDILMVPETR